MNLVSVRKTENPPYKIQSKLINLIMMITIRQYAFKSLKVLFVLILIILAVVKSFILID